MERNVAPTTVLQLPVPPRGARPFAAPRFRRPRALPTLEGAALQRRRVGVLSQERRAGAARRWTVSRRWSRLPCGDARP